MSYWTEIKNDHFVSGDLICPYEGDMLARVSIDGWRGNEEQGSVIAEVLLSKRGDILVSYRDWIAATDDMAQKTIDEAKDDLMAYFREHGELKTDQKNLQDLDGIVRILVRDCNGKRDTLVFQNNAAVLRWAEEEMLEDDEILLITQSDICIYSGLQADPMLTLTCDDITGFFA